MACIYDPHSRFKYVQGGSLGGSQLRRALCSRLRRNTKVIRHKGPSSHDTKTRAPRGIFIVLGSCFGCSTSRTTGEGNPADLDGAQRHLDILRRVHEHGGVPLHRDASRHGMRARRQENWGIDSGRVISLLPSQHDIAMAYFT